MLKAAKNFGKPKVGWKHNIVALGSRDRLAKSSTEDRHAIEKMAMQFQAFGYEHLKYVRNFMPQVGCPNRCAFCSQNSAKTVVRLSDRSLRNVVSAIKTVANEPSSGSLIGNRRDKGRSAVYPYLDTDICSYPYLYSYIKYLYRDLRVPVIISTVGYSRLNKHLQAMHERIVREFTPAIASITFSLTSYTYGWTEVAELSGLYSREDYELDMANAIRTYAPCLNILGPGRKTFCVALRFKPEISISSTQIEDVYLEGYHAVHAGPHLLISLDKGVIPKVSKVVGIRGRRPVFSQKPLPYLLATSDQRIGKGDWKRVAYQLIKSPCLFKKKASNIRVRKVMVYMCDNEDGQYYAVDPTFKKNGRFEALHIYQKTEKRRVSGYNNAERPFLNAILEYKKKKGIRRRGEFPAATWEDTEAVLELLRRKATKVSRYDAYHGKHIEEEIIPLVSSYVKILKHSGLRPAMFFHPHFTDDTGQIVNRGRAITQFRGLAGTVDAYMTPHEAKTFDEKLHPQEGQDYRLSPEPVIKNNEKLSSAKCSLSLAPIEYNPTFRHTEAGKTVQIKEIGVEIVPIDQFYEMKMLPGIRPKPHRNRFATKKIVAAQGKLSIQ